MADFVRGEEPATAGRVVLKTTVGDLQIDLWSQQAPLACRNFVQLCMERYYEDVVFHRVVKGFMAQTGDPTGTGTGGESIFEGGKAFKDEVHQRLTFSRAGLVAMASKDDQRNSNQSQFFVTLGPCEWLNKQHTIFGKVTGDSIYNLHKFAAIEVDANGRPTAPEPRILAVEVVDQPFTDIKPRKSRQDIEASRKRKQARKEEKRKKKARKHLDKKDMRLVSFGADEEEEENADFAASLSLQNDALQPSRDVRASGASAEVADAKQIDGTEVDGGRDPESERKHVKDEDAKAIRGKSHSRKRSRDKEHEKKDRATDDKDSDPKVSPPREDDEGNDDETRSRKSRSKDKDKSKKKSKSKDRNRHKDKSKKKDKRREKSRDDGKREKSRDEKSSSGDRKPLKDAANDELEKLREELRGGGTLSKSSKKEAKAPASALSAFEERRAKYLEKQRGGASQKAHQRNTLAKLEQFQAKLAKAGSAKPSAKAQNGATEATEQQYKGGIGENQMEDEGVQEANGTEWMHTELRFKRHIDDAFRTEKRDGHRASGSGGGDREADGDEAVDLTVIDAKTAQGRADFDQLEEERNRGPRRR